MSETESQADIFYGRIRHVMKIIVDTQKIEVLNLPMEISEEHDVVVMDWPLNMTAIEGGQVGCHNSRAACFTELSVEDLVILKRKIGVVEYNYPTRFSLESNRSGIRSKRISFFCDALRKGDPLLYEDKHNVDGKNIRLRGISRASNI